MGITTMLAISRYKYLHHPNMTSQVMNINTAIIRLDETEVHLHFRADSVGDQGVIEQIFQQGDYDISQWPQGQKLLDYHLEQSKTQPSLIIDAGANIGASAVFFSHFYPNSLVFAIEPDEMNWRFLELNTKQLNVFNFHGAIADVDGELLVEDPGRSDWGFMTRPVSDADQGLDLKRVKSISPASILAHPSTQNTKPLILKIDIEGGEDALFQGDTTWLNKFPLVIIELHDWMLPFSGSSRNFIKAIAQYDFDLLPNDENLFLFNRQILGA